MDNEEEQTLELGKVYTLRNGLTTSPLKASNNGTSYTFSALIEEPGMYPATNMSWLPNGRFLGNAMPHVNDIIFTKLLTI